MQAHHNPCPPCGPCDTEQHLQQPMKTCLQGFAALWVRVVVCCVHATDPAYALYAACELPSTSRTTCILHPTANAGTPEVGPEWVPPHPKAPTFTATVKRVTQGYTAGCGAPDLLRRMTATTRERLDASWARFTSPGQGASGCVRDAPVSPPIYLHRAQMMR